MQLPEAAGDPHAIVGRECHIIAQAAGGPRGSADDRRNIDGHENLVLLCANCHAVVDAQAEHFPPNRLRQIKASHESKIAARRSRGLPDVAIRGRDAPVRLGLMESGDSLLEISARCFAWAWAKPSVLSSSQRRALGNFMQSFSDWAEPFEEIGPKGQLEAGEALDACLAELEDERLRVYAGMRTLRLEVDDSTSPWPEAVIKIVHADDALGQPQTPVDSAA